MSHHRVSLFIPVLLLLTTPTPHAQEIEAARSMTKANGSGPDLTHQAWGRTTNGDGFVYGQTFASFGVAVADIDVDQDYDFILRPDFRFPPQLIRNLGTSGAFVPGGQRDMAISDPANGVRLTTVMDFEDFDSDGRPDMVHDRRDFLPSPELGVTKTKSAGKQISAPGMSAIGGEADVSAACL